MHFGIAKRSSKEVTLKDIQKRLQKKKKDGDNAVELFVQTCYEIADEKKLDAIIVLDTSYTFGQSVNEIKVLNARFSKRKGF